jgi:hypothetical protein
MLDQVEKAYYLALLALKDKDYPAASDHFDRAAPHFKDNREFNLLKQTTELLLAVKEERTMLDGEDTIELEEVLPYGEEKEFR